jgi:HEAT repeat protein
MSTATAESGKGQETSHSADPALSKAAADAFQALRSYDRGSGRALLLPIDEAVMASLKDTPLRIQLEQKLAAELTQCKTTVAQEYLCSKLALIGGALAVGALAPLLSNAEASTAARNALERISAPTATKALLESLPQLKGHQRIGVINSLGARRDPSSLRVLVPLLKESDVEVVTAAAAAIGEIASARSARALLAFQAHAPAAIQLKLADAMLVCAERLRRGGDPARARTLYQALISSGQATHVRAAAVRGFAACG